MNIYEVAERAGVSIATVSRVINRSAKVSSATRAKVEKVLEEMEFENGKYIYLPYYKVTIDNAEEFLNKAGK